MLWMWFVCVFMLRSISALLSEAPYLLSGVLCLSSFLKTHFPGAQTCFSWDRTGTHLSLLHTWPSSLVSLCPGPWTWQWEVSWWGALNFCELYHFRGPSLLLRSFQTFSFPCTNQVSCGCKEYNWLKKYALSKASECDVCAYNPGTQPALHCEFQPELHSQPLLCF